MSARLDILEARYRRGGYLSLEEHAELALLRKAKKASIVDDSDDDTFSPLATTSLISDAVDIAGDLLSGLSADSPSIDTGIDSTPDLGGGGGFGGGGGGFGGGGGGDSF